MPTRETYIPATKEDLTARLAAHEKLHAEDAHRFQVVSRLIATILHHTRFADLKRLRALYHPLDPTEKVDAPADPAAFLAAFDAHLAKASFMELPIAVMGISAGAMVQDLRLKLNETGVARVRFFARGARPGAVLLKHFGDVPQADLLALHPGATPTMQRRDQLIIGVPAIAGGVPLLAQLWSALTVLFALVAAWLGMESAINESQLKRALAALSGVIALGAFLMRQRLKYNAQRLAYQKQLADTVYFHTIANNAGVIDGLIGAAEQQDAKEAILAYWALLTGGPMDKLTLDRACEDFLKTNMQRETDFEIGDALAKLETFRLVTREGEMYRAVTTIEALARLDEAWDGFFSFTGAGA